MITDRRILITGGAGFIGTALAIKPILGLKEGVVAAVESVRTRKRAVARLVEIADQQPKTRPLWVGIIDSGSPELPEFQQALQDRLKPDLFITTTASPGEAVVRMTSRSWRSSSAKRPEEGSTRATIARAGGGE